MRKIIIKRTLLIYCLIIILVGTGFLSVIDTKNKIIHKGEVADKAFEQICFSYKKRLTLAKIVFPIQPVSFLSDTINKNSIYGYVKANMHFQIKLDSMILLASKSEGSNEIIEVKLKNNAKKIYELKKEYHKYAKDYNTFIKQFPRNYYANILNFPTKLYYLNI
ncbi:hypothetical protein ES708_01259 [subsurface metagenome]